MTISKSRLGFAFVVLASFGLGCGHETIRGDGNLVEEQRILPEFSAVRVENGLSGTIEPGDNVVELKIDHNLLTFVESFVSGRALRIRAYDDANLEPSFGYALHVKTRAVTSIDLSGGSRFFALATPVGHLSLDLSGGSYLEMHAIESDEVRAELSGGSELRLEGQANALAIEASGGSTVLSALPAESFHIEASGGSHVEVRASRTIGGEASGGSEIIVHGRPSGSIETSGASRVTFRDD